MINKHEAIKNSTFKKRCSNVGVNTGAHKPGESSFMIPWDLVKGRERKSALVDSCRKLLGETYKSKYAWLWAPTMEELEELEMVLKILRSQVEM